MGIICRVSDQLDRLTQIFAQAALGIIVTLFVVEVFARNVYGHSLTWVDEVAVTYLGTWFVFIGAAHAMKAGMLISFEFLFQRLSHPIRTAVFIGSQALILLFLAVIIAFGTRLSALTMSQSSPALQLPMGLAYLGVVTGCTLMFIHSVAAIVQKLSGGPNE